jgi:hypothetical protein
MSNTNPIGPASGTKCSYPYPWTSPNYRALPSSIPLAFFSVQENAAERNKS